MKMKVKVIFYGLCAFVPEKKPPREGRRAQNPVAKP